MKKFSSLEIIKLEDLTIPTDENVFSSLRTLDEIRKKIEDNTVVLDTRYLRKDIDDKAQGNITFDKNIFVQGEAALTNALIVESLYSDIHAADFDVAGFHLSADGDAWLNNVYAKKDSFSRVICHLLISPQVFRPVMVGLSLGAMLLTLRVYWLKDSFRDR